MIHQRPQEEEGEYNNNNPFETALLAAQGTTQFRTDALLNELAALVRKADLPWSNRFRLLHDIGLLRGHIHNETRRLLAEAQGRCN